MEGWRIAKPRYAQTPLQMLDGEGARLSGGRWNSEGVPMVYLGTSIAQASMEMLVHLNNSEKLKMFHLMRVSFDESMMEHIAHTDLPDNWREASVTPDIQQVGDEWIRTEESLILQVPSAAVPGGYNFLMNPLHPERSALKLGDILPYEFDPRLC